MLSRFQEENIRENAIGQWKNPGIGRRAEPSGFRTVAGLLPWQRGKRKRPDRAFPPGGNSPPEPVGVSVMMFTLTRAQVREFDRQAIQTYGVPGVVLMENAGRGCADWLMRLNPARQPVVILCGPGNNGGDGFVIARHLDNAGWPVRVHLFAPSYRDPTSEAAINYHIVKNSQISLNHYVPETMDASQLSPLRGEVAAAGWIVDALFGTGLSKPLGSPFAELVEAVAASGRPVFAVDIPSGLDCDTGEPLGPCIRATHTATFVAVKRGFLNPRSRPWTGDVQVIDIGAPRVLREQYQLEIGHR